MNLQVGFRVSGPCARGLGFRVYSGSWIGRAESSIYRLELKNSLIRASSRFDAGLIDLTSIIWSVVEVTVDDINPALP